MLGSQEEATTILRWVRASASKREGSRSPLGWKFLGRGVYRHVYLSPSGVAYKTDNREESAIRAAGRAGCNLDEFHLWVAIATDERFYPGWRVAHMSSFLVDGEIVIAAEYVQGTRMEHNERRCPLGDQEPAHHAMDCPVLIPAAKAFGVRDVHDDNYLQVAPGQYVIIDLS